MNQTLFVEAMASCTEITYVNGNLVGDPLDVKMFDSTGWSLVESAFDDQASNDQNIVLAYVQPKCAESIKLSFGGAASSEMDASAFISEPSYSSAIIRRFEFSSAL